jgi:outer membrane protein
MRPFFVLILAGLAIPGEVPGAQPVQTMTEEESVRLALEHSARLRGVLAEEAEARALVDEARAARRPDVSTRAGYTRIGGNIPEVEFTFPGLDSPIEILPFERDRLSAELSVLQPLFTGGRLDGQIRAATQQAEAAAQRTAEERADVAFEVRRAYWELYGALAFRDATAGSLAQVEAHLRDVAQRVGAGTALNVELLAAQTRRSEVLLERVEADNAVRLGRLELSRLTGLPLGTEVQPADRIAVAEVGEAAPDLESLTARALASRPQIQALEFQVEALRAEVDIARGERLPELGLLGRYIYGRPNPYAFTQTGEFRGTWEAGLQLQWSPWDGGASSARVRQAGERVQAAQARLDEARERVAIDVARQHLEARRATEALAVAAENVRQAEEAFRVARQQFDEGAALSSQVLEAEQAHRLALAREARAMADYAIARAAVRRALGEV